MHSPRQHCSSGCLSLIPLPCLDSRGEDLAMMRIPERSAAATGYEEIGHLGGSSLFEAVSHSHMLGFPSSSLLHPTSCVLFALLAQSAGLLSLSFKQLSLSFFQPCSLPVHAFYFNTFNRRPSGRILILQPGWSCSLSDAHFALRTTRETQDRERERNEKGNFKV
jgi:hypothetical protein